MRQAGTGIFSAPPKQPPPRITSGTNIEVNALRRTTISPNITEGGIKSNVIPSVATANLDIRAIPGEDMDKFRKLMEEVIHDPAVTIAANRIPEAPPTSTATDMYRVLESTQK